MREKRTSPVTNEPMVGDTIITNHGLRSQIIAWIEEQKEVARSLAPEHATVGDGQGQGEE